MEIKETVYGKVLRHCIDENTEIEIFEQGGIVNFLKIKGQSILYSYPDIERMIKSSRSQGALLFPFPNRLGDGKYSFNGKEFSLPINERANNNNLHGFVWKRKFDFIDFKEHEDGTVVFNLQYKYWGELDGFPFPFLLNITYRLNCEGLQIEAKIQNTGKESFPCGFGWHPYFQLSGNLNDWMLKVPEAKEIKVDSRMLPTGEQSDFKRFTEFKTIKNDNFDTCFKPLKNPVSISLKNEEHQLNIAFGDTLKYAQIYIPPHRKCIAIEPTSCNINAFNNLDDLLVLEPKQETTFNIQLNIV